MVRQQRGPYQGQNHPRPAPSQDPAPSAQPGRAEQTIAPAPQPPGAPPRFAQTAPLAERPPGASNASPAKPSLTPY